jgi:ferredoxin
MEEMYKHPKSVDGKYYIRYDWCIYHGVCEIYAPNNFKYDEELGGEYVYKQPSTPEEEAQCKQAIANCPIGAIRDDGETNRSLTVYPIQIKK